MELSENSIKLINILSSDTEKLNKFAEIFGKQSDKEEVYNYCVSLIPEYTKDEFEVMIQVLNNKKENLNSKGEVLLNEELENISGGRGGGGSQVAEGIGGVAELISNIIGLASDIKQKVDDYKSRKEIDFEDDLEL